MLTFIKILAWGVLWLLIWILSLPFKRGRTNCLSWAIDKWDQEGGYLVIRWCRQNKVPWIKWPHFLWIPEHKHQDMRHVIPDNEEENEDRVSPLVWFNPRIVKGDSKDL